VNTFDLPDLIVVGPALEQREQMSRKEMKRAKRLLRSKRFSANLIVDIGGAAVSYPSLNATVIGNSGAAFSSSGPIIGVSVDLIHADTFCNVLLAGTPFQTSGQLQVAIQTSDTDTSGNYTDPTSGLARFPRDVASGGIIWLNSGGLLGANLGPVQAGASSGAPLSGDAHQSGFSKFVAFQRPQNGRFVRLNVLSGGFYNGTLTGSLVSQQRTTGSGGGFSYQPGSGSINV